MMEQKGFHNVHLTVSSIGWHGATLKDISIGGDNPLTLKSLDLHYQPQELRNGTLRDLDIGGLALAAHNGPDGWVVAGFEDTMKKGAAAGTPFSFPVSAGDLKRLPFRSLKIDDSSLGLMTPSWRLDLPLTLEFQTSPGGKFTYTGDNLAFHMGGIEAYTGPVALSLTLDEQAQKWTGPWSVKALNLKGGSSLPVMDGAGTASASDTRMSVKGMFANKDKSYNVAFTYDGALNDPDKNVLTVTSASLPWNHGTLSVHNVRVPVSGSAPIRLTVNVANVSVDDLMQSLTGKRVTATGTVSGAIPVTIGRDGSFTLSTGNLKASGPGRIALPPDIIPGDNAQIVLVRQLLQDLHYTDLQVALGAGDSKKLSVTMTIAGNNPAVYNGRPVKLNVHLGGDVLDLIRQNVMLLTDPKQMLNQGK
jgi:hypothetical protein